MRSGSAVAKGCVTVAQTTTSNSTSVWGIISRIQIPIQTCRFGHLCPEHFEGYDVDEHYPNWAIQNFAFIFHKSNC